MQRFLQAMASSDKTKKEEEMRHPVHNNKNPMGPWAWYSNSTFFYLHGAY